MGRKTRNDVLPVETPTEYLVKRQEGFAHVACKDRLRKAEIVFIVEHVEIVDNSTIGDVAPREADNLVEYRQGIAHAAICLLRNNVESLGLGRDLLLSRHVLQMLHHIMNGDTCEIIYLTTR